MHSEENSINDRRPAPRNWPKIAAIVLGGAAVLGLVAYLGRLAGHEVLTVERWVGELGAWGPILLLLLMILCTSLLIPDTLFAVVAGAVFGLWWGTVLTWLGATLTAAVNFWISRRLLHGPVQRLLEKRPQLSAVERAASREGARLQILLRLSPMHAATLSYAMGASRVKFADFLIGCLGLGPMMFVEVYFGYVASHLAKLAGGVPGHSRLHTVVTMTGFVVSLAVLAYVTRVAHRAITQSSALGEAPA